jgi:hypothetical protein
MNLVSKIILSSVSAIGVIILIAFLATSTNKKVKQNEFAVVYNEYTTKVKDVLDQGVYTLDFGDKLKYYIATVQYMHYDNLQCFSQDGLVIVLDISVQFSYDKNSIVPIMWYVFNKEKNYMMILRNVVEESVRTACADFLSFEYYTTRQLVETKMYMELMDNINRTDIHINLHLFQLKNIDFPSSYNNIISEKQSVIQMSQTEMNKRQSELILANTTYIQAVQTAKQLLIQAENQKQLTLFQANTTANIIQTEFEQKALSYEYIMTQLNLNATGMIDYLESEIIRTSGNMYVGL